jgi:mannose-1-phosphate guanylyltransferase
VLTSIDLAAVIRLHRERRAKATIVLTPIDDPGAYGLVETDADGNIRRFLEKPKPEDITTRNINAGVYVLEPETFDRIPSGVPWSIERGYFPSLVERGETFVAYLYDGYWIDIGTPEKYRQVHQDIMSGRFVAAPFRDAVDGRLVISPSAHVHADARVSGPCYIDDGAVIEAGATILPNSVIGRDCHIGASGRAAGSGPTAPSPARWSAGTASSARTFPSGHRPFSATVPSSPITRSSESSATHDHHSRHLQSLRRPRPLPLRDR